MADGNDVIQRAPLLPPNSPSVTEADRARIYAIIGRELDSILNGPASYYSDSVKKSSGDLMSELNSFVDGVSRLRGLVNDPSNILGGIGLDLKKFREAFESGIRNDVETMWNDPRDSRDQKIRLPDNVAPTTEDRNVIYVDPEPDPWFPQPNPVAPNPTRERRASIAAPYARAGAIGLAASAGHPVYPASNVLNARLGGMPRWSGEALAFQPKSGTSTNAWVDEEDGPVRGDLSSVRILSRVPSRS